MTTYTHEVVLCTYNMATKQNVETVISRHKSRAGMLRAFNRAVARGRNVIGRKIDHA